MTDESKPIYTARIIGKVKNEKGWDYSQIGVFNGDLQVGQYLRNYGSFFKTFFPFEQNGKWYALYSSCYTATRVMALPKCTDSECGQRPLTDLGGEESNGFGFCPMEYFVPELCGQYLDPNDPCPRVANHDSDKWAVKVKEGEHMRYYWPDDPNHPMPDEGRRIEYIAEKERSQAASRDWRTRYPFRTEHAKWGFVSGCVWGDDSSMKVQFLDLSRAWEGILVRDDRFGYIELPPKVSLADAISEGYECDDLNAPIEKLSISIALPVRFKLTGDRIKEED